MYTFIQLLLHNLFATFWVQPKIIFFTLRKVCKCYFCSLRTLNHTVFLKTLFTNYDKSNAALQFSTALRSFSVNITTNGHIIPRKKLNCKDFKKRTLSPIRFHLWTRSFFFSFVFYFQFKLSVLSPDFLDKKFAGKSWVWNEWLIKSDEGASKVFLATSLQKNNSSF